MVVVPLKSTSGTVKNLKSPDEMDMEEVLTCKLLDEFCRECKNKKNGGN